jgi:hypothetical protein
MSILRFENRTPRTLQGIYDYVLDPSKTSSDLSFTIGVGLLTAVKEMELVRRCHNKKYTSPYVHFIFCFDKNLNGKSHLYLCAVAKEIALALIHDQRQCFGAVHINKPNQLHIHIIINTTSINGELWRQQGSVLYYKKKVNTILIKYGLTPIKFDEYKP